MAKRRLSGDGMVRRRDDGRWEGRIVVGHKDDGGSIFHYVSAKTQKALLEKLHRSIDAYDGADLTEDSRMTLSQWLDIWLDECAAPTLRESTLRNYRHYIEYHIKPRLGHKQLYKITTSDVQGLYRELQESGRKKDHPKYGHGLSSATIRRLHSVLHQAMDAAVRRHLAANDPTEGVTLPKGDPPSMRVLNGQQLERFMEEIKKDPFWHDFFYLEMTTGLRRGELCGLMWSDFDEKEGTLSIRRTLHPRKGGGVYTGETKTGRGRRIITLPPSTAQLLRERKKPLALSGCSQARPGPNSRSIPAAAITG